MVFVINNTPSLISPYTKEKSYHRPFLSVNQPRNPQFLAYKTLPDRRASCNSSEISSTIWLPYCNQLYIYRLHQTSFLFLSWCYESTSNSLKHKFPNFLIVPSSLAGITDLLDALSPSIPILNRSWKVI